MSSLSCWRKMDQVADTHTLREWVKDTEIASRLSLRSTTARMTKQFGKLIYLSFSFPFHFVCAFLPPLWLSSSKNICNKMLQGQELQQILQMLKDNMLKFKQIHARAYKRVCVCVCAYVCAFGFPTYPFSQALPTDRHWLQFYAKLIFQPTCATCEPSI